MGLVNCVKLVTVTVLLCLLVACSNHNFYHQKTDTIPLSNAYGYGVLPDLSGFTQKQLRRHCESQDRTTILGVTLLLHCTKTLLGHTQLSNQNRQFALKHYTNAIEQLFQHIDKPHNLVQVNYSGPRNIFLVSNMVPNEERLYPKVFGELGSAAVSWQNNKADNLANIDPNYPLEGKFFSYSIYVSDITLQGLRLHVSLQATPVSTHQIANFGENHYTFRYSPAAAYLGLLQVADINNFSWLGFTNAEKAESRMGVFSIGELSTTKTPLIMIHGLNSDPLIWRYLTMALLNDETLSQQYQIWHIYYPSGPPPFYNAMRVRKHLNALVKRLGIDGKSAVFVGHSMGGIITKLLTTQPHYALWDATFVSPADTLTSEEDADLRDVFLFSPTFDENTTFFLDTPHRGSEVANSVIGTIGSSLISLPSNFRNLFGRFIQKVGIDKLTAAMLPFLQNHGPDSVQVLRPNHPLMTTLAELPVEGKSYSIIGSTGALSCTAQVDCVNISDSVVDYSSAYLPDAQETIIVTSSHNSFKNPTAIAFIADTLRKKP